MIDNDIIQVINNHKIKSAKPIVDNQITYIPTVEDNQIECTVPRYLIDGKRIPVNPIGECCFRLYYLRFQSIPPRVANNHKNGVWGLEYLVNNGILYPIMVFINGYFIPWDNIEIGLCQDKYHMHIHAYSNQQVLSVLEDMQWVKVVTLPSHATYEPGYASSDDTVLFSFDASGKFSKTAHDYVFRSGTDHHIIYNYWSTTNGVNAFKVLNATSLKLTGANVILFKDGLLATGTKYNIKRAQECEDHKDPDTGHTYPCYHFNVSDEELDPNPEIKFDSSLLTIGDGTNSSGSIYDFGVFINTKYTPTVDNINRTDLDGLSPYIQNQNAGTSNPEFLQQLQIGFEMEMDRKKYYDDNVADAIKTMLSYNASLFNEVFLKKSNLVIEEYTGAEFSALMQEDGTVVLSRDHGVMIDEYILIFVNGTMYEYTNMIKYSTDKCIIPIQDINADDTVEVFRFKNIINQESEIIVYEDDGYKPYSSDVINDEMVLFSDETNTDYFEFPDDGLQHFVVEYSLDTNEAGEIKITLTNPFYYGKRLKLVYKNQYKHCRFILAETQPEEFKIDLGSKFMYCNDYFRYFVFLNGNRLSTEQYRMTLPVRTTTPFSRFEMYLTMPINDGDVLDIIYVPSMIKDVILIPSIPVSGDIIIDKSLIGYGLSKDLYMVWVNGKKVPASKIADIDSTHLRITADVQSTETVIITKYIPDIDAISSVFKDNEALWDSIMSKLTNDEIHALLGINGEDLTNTDTSLYADSINVRTIMFELIREQYMMNTTINITEPFIYDYQDVDTTAIEGYDSGDNAMLPVADSNRTDNLSDVSRPWP